MKLKNIIDFHKGSTSIFVLFLIYYYEQWNNATLWIYWSMHGSYGLLWCLKSLYFPDRQWEQSVSLGFGLLSSISLSLYWIAPIIIATRSYELPLPPWYIASTIMLFSIGVFLHFSSDMQKHCYMTLRPSQLMTDGLWTRTRNPNYLGELLIYASFAMVACHWLPVVILASWITFYWLPNMMKKDKSLSRYPTFKQYASQSGLLFPTVRIITPLQLPKTE